MPKTVYATDVQANGTVRLPKPVQQALRLKGKHGIVGFVIDGKRILMTRARIVPDPTLSDEELAALARLSKRGAGKRSFRTVDAALRHLWNL